MKTITLEIDEKFATIITLTLVGNKPYSVDVTTAALDLNKIDKITVANNGAIRGTATDATPAADAVEVVRCKDCKYFYYNNKPQCSFGHGLCIVDEKQYCSYGERREG